MDTVLRDLRYAFRALRRNVGFTIAVTLTLALGAGAATATFALVSAVLLRPLPVRDQDRLAVFWAEDGTQRGVHIGVPWGLFRSYGIATTTLAGLAAVTTGGTLPSAVRDGSRLTSLSVMLVTGDLFRVLGIAPAVGRTLTVEDDALGAPPVAVVSYKIWRTEFGGDPGVVGRTLDFIGARHTIVGVAPPDFEFPIGAEVWTSLAQWERRLGADPAEPTGGWLDLVGGLKPGVTLEQARSELGTFLREYQSQSLGAPQHRVVGARPFAELITGDLKPGLTILSIAVALVLVIACVNVAGLVLTRGLARRAELAVRSALGARPARLVRQLVTEHGVLAAAGGLAGVGVAAVALRAALSMAPAGLPRLGQARLDSGVLAFALAVSIGAVLFFGVAPAVAAVRENAGGALGAGGGRAHGDRRTGRARRLIVITQVALAVAVLVGSGLLAKSLARLQQLDLGFDPDHLLFVGLEFLDPFSADSAGRASAEARFQLGFDALVERLPSEPEVVAVTATVAPPFSGGGLEAHYLLKGRNGTGGEHDRTAGLEVASDDHFRALGIRLVRGRTFAREDRSGSPPVLVVSESFARGSWPGQDPLGQRVRLGTAENGDAASRTVVGVVADTRYRTLTAPPLPTVYVPVRQTTDRGVFVTIRTANDPRRTISDVRRALQVAAPALGIRKVKTGPELLAEPLARPRFLAAMLAALSVAATLLAAVGVYGVLAAAVRQRSHELAIRMALGASPARVQVLIFGQAAVLAGTGIALGLLVTLAGARALRAVLFEVAPHDPQTLTAAVGLLLGIFAVAAYGPARRASRLDPLAALRAE